MYILVRVVAFCLFGTAARVQNQSVEFNGESDKAKACARLTTKWKYFQAFLTFRDGEYTCEMQVMHLEKELGNVNVIY